MGKSTVIIPNWNGKEYLKPCLDSLLEQRKETPYIIVADNGSQDGSAAFIRENYPFVKLIEFEENTGFCHAVNEGIRAAETEYVILLNNDTKADRNFVEWLEKAMETDENVFSVSGKLLSMEQPSLVDDAGDFYCALGWAYAAGKGKMDGEAFQKPGKIFAACAGAAIYRKCILEEIGFFDEAHFAYLEDIDIGYRARIYGYVNLFEPKAQVLHAGSATSGSKYNEFKVNFSARNSVYIIRKNMPAVQILLNLPFLIPGFLLKAVFFTIKGFGKIYIRGLFKGWKLGSSEEGRRKKVKFKGGHLKNYIIVQWELWVNVFRRLRS